MHDTDNSHFVARFFVTMMDNRWLSLSVFLLVCVSMFGISVLRGTVYEIERWVESAVFVDYSQVFFAPGPGQNMDDRLRIYVDRPRYVEEPRLVAKKLLNRYGGGTPLLSSMEGPLVYSALEVHHWDGATEVRFRGPEPASLLEFSKQVLDELTARQNAVIEDHRKELEKLLLGAEREKARMVRDDDGESETIAHTLLDERIFRIRQDLEHTVRFASLVDGHGGGPKKISPRPLETVVLAIFVAVLASVVVVVIKDWTKTIRAGVRIIRSGDRE